MSFGESSKAELRAHYRAKRRALSAEQQQRHARAIAQTLAEHVCGARLRAETVAVYLRQDGEADLEPLVAQGRQQGVAFAVPILVNGDLDFAAYGADEQLRRGRHGLLEPANPVPVRPAIVLTPLVAFDEQGYRLGMGGGYYDRYFAAHPDADRIGVAHECQRADNLPAEPWDMRLAAVATECGWHRFGAGGLVE